MKTKRYNFFRLKMSKLLVGEHEAQRSVKPCNMGNAKKAGLLFAVNSETDVADAEYVFNHLKDNNISVSALGYMAHFRIGRFADKHPFDLMMCITDDKDVKYYYEQIIFYLQKFN